MAPVQLDPVIRYDLVAVALGQVVAGFCLTAIVGRSLWRSYRSLGPAQDTRERRAQRHKAIPLFAALAVASLASAAYSSTNHAVLSYKVWAGERGIEVPQRFYGNNGTLPWGANSTDVFLLRWLSDTRVYLDAVEILSEKARRFWWAQQIDLGLLPWTMLLAIEGRRRNMPLLWSYQLLAQLVSLSFAQNLFFIALLLTPTPLPAEDGGSLPVSRYIHLRNSIFPPKPSNWTAHPLLYLSVIIPNLAAIASLSTLANTPSLPSVVVAARALSFAPLIVPYVVPRSWGRIHVRPHEVYSQYSNMFKFISFASYALQTKATLVGLAYSAPDAHYHRHSIYLPFDTERRSAWERTTSGFGRILGAMGDHPVVSSAGSDVILSAIAVGLWAAIRATDASDILASTVPFFKLQSHGTASASAKSTAIKSKGSRRSKGKTGSISSLAEITDGSEAGSVRRRGKAQKVKAEPDEASDDETYQPTPAVAAAVAEGDVLPEAGALGLESTALVWGMVALGGLGVGTAGALGGECVAR